MLQWISIWIIKNTLLNDSNWFNRICCWSSSIYSQWDVKESVGVEFGRNFGNEWDWFSECLIIWSKNIQLLTLLKEVRQREVRQ